MSDKKILQDSFLELLQEVMPKKLIEQQCSVENGVLSVLTDSYDLNSYKNIYLLGSGKAVVPMAESVHDLLGEYIKETLLVGLYDFNNELDNTTYIKSTHPFPSDMSIKAAKAVEEKIADFEKDDFFIYLLSGGTSALMELPQEGITLDDLQEVTSLMLYGGLPIQSINSVRKHLSRVKGGRVVANTKTEGIVLALSDVIGDDLHAIGSAPLYYDKTTFNDALVSLRKYGIFEKIPKSVQTFLIRGEKDSSLETPKTANKYINHYILGSNRLVLEKAQAILSKKGIKSTVVKKPIEGDTLEVAQELFSMINSTQDKAECYILGGESTVKVTGNGKGGRNQHLCLKMLLLLKQMKGITFLSAATDGIDGNSQAAGAIIDNNSYSYAIINNIDPQQYFDNFDSYNYFLKTSELIVSGPTHNNLLDIVIILIKPKRLKGELNG